MSSLTSKDVIFKQPTETIDCAMDFSNWVGTGITLSNPTVSSEKYGGATSDLTISSVTVVGQTVEMTIAGGTDEERYRIEVEVDTSSGEHLEGDGILHVTDR